MTEDQLDQQNASGLVGNRFHGRSDLANLPGVPRGGAGPLDVYCAAVDDLAAKVAQVVPIGDVFDSGSIELTNAQLLALESLSYIRRDGNCWRRIA